MEEGRAEERTRIEEITESERVMEDEKTEERWRTKIGDAGDTETEETLYFQRPIIYRKIKAQ